MSDPLASLRASLKAGKPTPTANVWKVGSPTSTAPSKADPLASLRASLKSGKSPTAKAAPVLPTTDRLTRLESAVKGLLKVAITEESRAHLKQFS
jgi:hypothetical protein